MNSPPSCVETARLPGVVEPNLQDGAESSALRELASSEMAPPLTMGDLLDTVSSLLQEDPALCWRFVGCLKGHERLRASPLNGSIGEVQRVLSSIRPPGSTEPASLISAQRLPHEVTFTEEVVVPAKRVVSTVSFTLPEGGHGVNGTKLPKVTTDLTPEDDEEAEDNGVVSVATDKMSSNRVVRVRRSSSSRSSNSGRPDGPLPWFPGAIYGSLRHRIFLLFDDPSASKGGRVIAVVLIVAIAVSTVSFVLESMPEFRTVKVECATDRTVANCEPKPHESFWYLEAVCIVTFTADYIIRMCTISAAPNKATSNPVMKTLLYMKQPLNIVDLVAILPFYVDLAIAGSVGVMRVFRLARILRPFKAAKHHSGMMMLKDVMLMSRQPLMILAFFNAIMTILFGSLIYFAEGLRYSVDEKFTLNGHPTGVFVREAASLDGDEVSPFRSIPYSVWWTLVTMTTVGYGDFSPTTRAGKVIGIACFYVGIIFLALPISVLGNNFEIAYNRMMEAKGLSSTKKTVGKRDKKTVVMKPLESIPGDMLWLPACTGKRRRLFILLEDPNASKVGKWLSLGVIMTILVSTAVFIMESMPDFNETPSSCRVDFLTVQECRPMPLSIFGAVELVCIIIFTVEYLGRVMTVHAATSTDCGLPPDATIGPLKLTFRYATQWLNLIDLVAILPFYVELAGGGGGGAAVLRVLRLVRTFRVLKMPKLRACGEMFIDVVVDALPALFLLFFMTTLMCVLFASLIVFAESSQYSVDYFQEDYPQGLYVRPTKDGYGVEPSPFRSILYAFWWFFTTATTVGYGDDFPTTTAGRIVGVSTFYTGIVLIALPITIISGCFNKRYPEYLSEFGGNQPHIKDDDEGTDDVGKEDQDSEEGSEEAWR
eukprot:TRINITY_DN5910_c0_g1_i1.p1 TRINITY_DN5910_c0_g1~~TRINITY_DN5910_c0_g1_i1.p1  ORF type:complete len:881 (+),score=166.62 TRINITY_DN5910_c0_g1_i1:118-2760(+)